MEDSVKLIVKAVLGFVILVMAIVMVSCTMTTVAADELVIKQDVMSGELHVWDTPGVHYGAQRQTPDIQLGSGGLFTFLMKHKEDNATTRS